MYIAIFVLPPFALQRLQAGVLFLLVETLLCLMLGFSLIVVHRVRGKKDILLSFVFECLGRTLKISPFVSAEINYQGPGASLRNLILFLNELDHFPVILVIFPICQVMFVFGKFSPRLIVPE